VFTRRQAILTGLESALPVREALHRGAPGELPEDYILNVFGEVDPVASDAILKDNTTLEHKGDQIKLNRVEPAPKNSMSEAGTLFYFSRRLALRLEDQEATFTTRLGPLKVKCKLRGNLRCALAIMLQQSFACLTVQHDPTICD